MLGEWKIGFDQMVGERDGRIVFLCINLVISTLQGHFRVKVQMEVKSWNYCKGYRLDIGGGLREGCSALT